MDISTLLDRTYFDNSVLEYCIAAGTILLSLIVAPIASALVCRSLRRALRYTLPDLAGELSKLAAKTVTAIVWLGSIQLALTRLELSPILTDGIGGILTLAIAWVGIRLVYNSIDCGLRYFAARRNDPSLTQAVEALRPIVRVIIWAIGFIFAIDNLGFNVSAAVASLGIGGVAIALASQGILSDLFSYASIICDRPFEIGDFILIGDDAGTVEHIGIKTTRLRRLSGEELVVANSELVSVRVRNFRDMPTRRIVFQIGVVYETGREQLGQIPAIVRHIIESIDDANFERAHFLNFGDFSLNYEIVYHVQTSDYMRYTDIQQEINLALFDAFTERGIEFAYPTQVLHLQGSATASEAESDGVVAA
ncbi:MAG: mechanosensitive ion channel family protein [Geitlerinemataceae cyanobacterium]